MIKSILMTTGTILSSVLLNSVVFVETAQAGECKWYEIFRCQETIYVKPRPAPVIDSNQKIIEGNYYTKPKFIATNLSRLYLDSNFTQAEEDRIYNAYTTLDNLINSQATFDCINTYYTSGEVVNGAETAAGLVYYKNLKLFVDKGTKKELDTSLGRANIGGVNNSQFKIKLNADKFNETNFSSSISINHHWAGIIAHEMFHNLGYDHEKLKKDQNGDTIFTPVFGNAVYEAGWCIARNNASKTPGTYGLTENQIAGDYVDGLVEVVEVEEVEEKCFYIGGLCIKIKIE